MAPSLHAHTESGQPGSGAEQTMGPLLPSGLLVIAPTLSLPVPAQRSDGIGSVPRTTLPVGQLHCPCIRRRGRKTFVSPMCPRLSCRRSGHVDEQARGVRSVGHIISPITEDRRYSSPARPVGEQQ